MENEHAAADLIKALSQKAVDNNSLGGFKEAMEEMQNSIEGMLHMQQETTRRIAMALQRNDAMFDSIRHAILSIVDIMVDNNLLTEEDWDRIQEENLEKQKKMYEERERMHQEAIAAAQEQAKMEQEEQEEDDDEEDNDSGVVLASERGGVTRFSDKEEE